MSDEPPVVDQMRCISVTGLHDFMPPVVVRQGIFHNEVAVTFCRICGAYVVAGWCV